MEYVDWFLCEKDENSSQGGEALGLNNWDVIVIGGGPGGSACATKLVEAGARVAVLDRARFPRTKLCAGWVTPEALFDLEFNIDNYPHRFKTFENVVVHIKGLTLRLPGPQHSIRRFEFDDYLMNRSGADFFVHHVKGIQKENDHYIIDGEYRCEYLVGAGGTHCPVYHSFFREVNPRARNLQVVAFEQEFLYEWTDPNCHLWFFDKGLPGYAWYVPKEQGYLNCGIGGMAEKLKARNEDIKHHWRFFIHLLERKALVQNFEYEPKGYSYYLRGDVKVIRVGNAFIVGDAIGLATRDLAEGIGPAIRSGHLAAKAINSGSEYSLEQVAAYSSNRHLVRSILEYMLV